MKPPQIAIFLSLVFVASVFHSNQALASVRDEALVQKRLLEGQTLILKREYNDALKVFDELKKNYPDSPAGCFGEMAAYEVQMLEREDLHLQRRLKMATEEGLRRVNRVMQQYNPTPWDLFISGSLHGLDGFFKARKGKWWDAYVAGNKSRQLFKHVKEIDPNYIDADFGLGMYLYWRSVFTRDLWFLKFIPNKRDEGIAIVKNVAEHGKFAKDMAQLNLGLAYLEEKMYPQSEEIFSSYAKMYPQNIIIRRLLGKVYAAEKKYDEAVLQFRAMLEIDSQLKKPHYFLGAVYILKGDPKYYPEAEKELRYFIKIQKGTYWPASAHYWLGRLAEKRGDKKSARTEYEIAYGMNSDIKDALKRARGMGSGI